MDQKNWKGNGIRVVMAMGLLLMAITTMTAMAEAKTYNDFAGHSAVQYENKDVITKLRPYVDHVDYDTAYSTGYGYGCRLYLTEEGRKNVAAGNIYLLNAITYSVMGASEWKQERTLYSVREEIRFHSDIGRRVSGIEYYYQDLNYREYWKYI